MRVNTVPDWVTCIQIHTWTRDVPERSSAGVLCVLILSWTPTIPGCHIIIGVPLYYSPPNRGASQFYGAWLSDHPLATVTYIGLAENICHFKPQWRTCMHIIHCLQTWYHYVLYLGIYLCIYLFHLVLSPFIFMALDLIHRLFIPTSRADIIKLVIGEEGQ